MSVDIAIGIPKADTGVAYKEHLVSLNGLINEIDALGYTTATIQNFGCNCSENRNAIVETAKKYKARYLLLLDNDMCFFPGAFTKLFKADKDIISGIYVYRDAPHKPVAYHLNEEGRYVSIEDWEKDSVFEVDGAGGGFMLIKMSVFDVVEEPYFSIGERNGIRIGNDFYFCDKAQRAGFKIWLDSSADAGHLGVYPYTIRNYYAYKDRTDEKVL